MNHVFIYAWLWQVVSCDKFECHTLTAFFGQEKLEEYEVCPKYRQTVGTYDLMNGASAWERCERVGRAYDGVQWRVKSRTWDWWGSPAARYGFSSRKSHRIRVFTIVTCMAHTVQRVFASKCAVERGPKFDIRHEFIGMGWEYTRFTPRALPQRRCCFVNYKLSDRRSHAHAHGGRVYILSFASKFPWARLADRIGGFSWVRTPCKFCPKADFVDYPGCASRGSVGCNKFYRAGRQVLPRRDKLRIVFHILCRIRSGIVEINDVI